MRSNHMAVMALLLIAGGCHGRKDARADAHHKEADKASDWSVRDLPSYGAGARSSAYAMAYRTTDKTPPVDRSRPWLAQMARTSIRDIVVVDQKGATQEVRLTLGCSGGGIETAAPPNMDPALERVIETIGGMSMCAGPVKEPAMDRDKAISQAKDLATRDWKRINPTPAHALR